MRKLLKSLFLILGLVVSLTAMTACSDDDNEGGLFGVYGKKYNSYDYGSVYHFINSNTVVYYAEAHYGWTSGKDWMSAAKQQIGSSNWYACEGNSGPSTYTYTEKGNKVIIPMKGVIMTKSGKNLIEDGGGTFVKD